MLRKKVNIWGKREKHEKNTKAGKFKTCPGQNTFCFRTIFWGQWKIVIQGNGEGIVREEGGKQGVWCISSKERCISRNKEDQPSWKWLMREKYLLNFLTPSSSHQWTFNSSNAPHSNSMVTQSPDSSRTRTSSISSPSAKISYSKLTKQFLNMSLLPIHDCRRVLICLGRYNSTS